MKFLLLIVVCAFIFGQIEGRSRSGHHNFPSFPRSHEADRPRWTPFKRFDNSTSAEESSADDEGSTEAPTEEKEGETSERSGHFEHQPWHHESRHQESTPAPPPPPPSDPIVHIEWGTIRGVVETHAGINVSTFYGIPYAEPPVGRLRFRLPVKIGGRHHGIYNATSPKPACMQSLTGTPIDEPVSEDCLHMNIWVPREEETESENVSQWGRSSHEEGHERSHEESRSFLNSPWWSSHRGPSHRRSSPSLHHRSSGTRHHKYPVLFYVYGSQFKKHSSTYPINRGGIAAAKGRFIVVSFNYRLQSFGFAYGDDHFMPGNQALYDILAALEWTRENIRAFGGDPDRITVSGSSAGSELAAMLALSPAVSPFHFDQVVLMSAVPMRPTSIESKSIALNKTKALAAKLGCGEFPSHDFRLSREQLECLQAVNATDIAEADTTDDILMLGSCPDFAFMPIYGDDFMPNPPEEYLMKKQARRNMKFIVGSDHWDDVETGNYEPASRAEAEGHLNNMFTNMIKPHHNISRDLEYLYNYYFEDVADNDTWALKDRLGQLIGDNMFQCPLLLFLEKWAVLNPIHYYYFNHSADAFANSADALHQHGPGHGAANFMFMGQPFLKEEFSDRDREVSTKMINLLSNFVYKGEAPWPPMLVSRRNKVLPLEFVIDEQVDPRNVKVNPKMNICRFMLRLYNIYF